MNRPTPSPRIPLSLASYLGAAVALIPGCFDPTITVGSDAGTDGSESSGATEEDASSSTGIDPDSSDDATIAICGDGIVEGDEQCDDELNDGSYGHCLPDCTALGPHCGDGVINGEEPCDDGDEVDGNGCNVDCVVSGSVLWTVTYDGPDHESDSPSALTVDSNDNIIVAGVTSSSDISGIWLAKYDTSGEQIWQTSQYAHNGDSRAYDVAVTSNDDIIVVGSTTNPTDENNTDIWIRMYDSTGDSKWTRTHDGAMSKTDTAFSVDTDASGNIYIGTSEDNTSIYRIQKYTSEGDELWSVISPSTALDDLDVTPAGTINISARKGTPQHWTPVIANLTTDGTLEWSREYNEYAPGWFNSISTNAHGNIALPLNRQGESAARILELTMQGDEVWSTELSEENNHASVVLIDDVGNIVTTGNWDSDKTLWVTKYQPDRSIAWIDTYNGEESFFGFDQGRDVATDSQNNVIVAGIIDTGTLHYDIWMRKYAP